MHIDSSFSSVQKNKNILVDQIEKEFFACFALQVSVFSFVHRN
jgi:hypothetical protein